GLGLVVLAAAARPLHHELKPTQGASVLAYVIPMALAPALLVRFALARRWLALMALLFVVFAAVSALGFAGALIPVKPIQSHHRVGQGTGDSSSTSTSRLLTSHGGGTHSHVSIPGSLVAGLLALVGL